MNALIVQHLDAIRALCREFGVSRLEHQLVERKFEIIGETMDASPRHA